MADEGFELYASTMRGRAGSHHRRDHPANRSNTTEQQVVDRMQFIQNGITSVGQTIFVLKTHLDAIAEIDEKQAATVRANLIAFFRDGLEHIDPSLGAPKEESPKKPSPGKGKARS